MGIPPRWSQGFLQDTLIPVLSPSLLMTVPCGTTCQTLHLVAARTCGWGVCLRHPYKCRVQVTCVPMSPLGMGQ